MASWVAHVDASSGKPYYHNAATSETVWKRPAAMGPAPAGSEWMEKTLDCGKVYWEHAETEETVWEAPASYSAYVAKRDWREREDPDSGDVYYYNERTRETAWEAPPGYDSAEAAPEAVTTRPGPEVVPRENPVALFDTTAGSFEAEIFLDRTPVLASNFIDLANNGFYDGLLVHRVDPDRMVWFGCPYAKVDLAHEMVGKGLPPAGAFQNLWTGDFEKRLEPGYAREERTDRTEADAGVLLACNHGRVGTTGGVVAIAVVDAHECQHWNKGPSKWPVLGRLRGGHSRAVAAHLASVPTERAPDGTLRPISKLRVNGVAMRSGETRAGVFASAEDVRRALEDRSMTEPRAVLPPAPADGLGHRLSAAHPPAKRHCTGVSDARTVAEAKQMAFKAGVSAVRR